MKKMTRIFKNILRRRIDFHILIDFPLAFFCVPFAYFLRSGFFHFHFYSDFIFISSILFCLIFFGSYFYFKLHKKIWRFTSAEDVIQITIITLVATIVWYGLAIILRNDAVLPRSIPVLVFIIELFFLCSVRILSRYVFENKATSLPQPINSTRVFLVGDIESVNKTIAAFKKPIYSHYEICGIITSDDKYSGKFLRGIPVVGHLKKIHRVFNNSRIPKVDLAIFVEKTPNSNYQSDIFNKFIAHGIATMLIPTLGKLSIHASTSQTPNQVDYDHLLRRSSFVMDAHKKFHLLHKKTILITGAGGSIGSEIVRQVLHFEPLRIVLLDNSEYALYKIDQEIQKKFPHIPHETLLADVRDAENIRTIMNKFRPDIVFHAAAVKHVPLAELNPLYTFDVNVIGSRNMMEAAAECDVKLLVLISTDKAVNPTSVMGCTKRMAEIICTDMNKKYSPNTQFLTVRFGNVIGSSGSVIPLFEKQIDEGGPITITHPDIKRFFMAISEAVDLILECSSLYSSHEISMSNSIGVLNMGDPIKITDLAEQLAVLKGKKIGQDIRIVYTGLRSGEKLTEELFDASEKVLETGHSWLHVAMIENQKTIDHILHIIQNIENDLRLRKDVDLRQKLIQEQLIFIE